MTSVKHRDALPPPLSKALAIGECRRHAEQTAGAEHLAALYDHAQRRAGRSVWTAPVVLPWHAGSNGSGSTSWHRAAARTAGPHIATGQANYLWSRIVAAEGLPLLDARGAADLAAEAWTLAHAWGAGGPSWRSWSGRDDDSAIFARWAEDYSSAVAQAGGLDAAQLPDWLASLRARSSCVARCRRGAGRKLGIEFSPQQERLLAAVAATGMRIARLSTLPSVEGDAIAGATRQTGATPRDEVGKALAWRATALWPTQAR